MIGEIGSSVMSEMGGEMTSEIISDMSEMISENQ